MNDYVITWRVEERVVNAGGGFMYTRVAAGTTAISILAAPTDLYVQTAPPPGVTASSLVGYVSPDGVLDNPLVIVEGYDSSNHDFAPRFLGPLMEPGPGPPSFVWYLLTIGYDIYFYNFGDARLSMRDNALGMLGAIRRLNQEVVSPAYQTRVLAFSMGGVVARYALAWGEEYGYPHGCDMLVSADAPHQGAWLSLSFQTWLRGIEGSNATAAKIAAPLKTTAGKELLFANVFDIPIGQPPPPGGTPMAVDFRDELNGLNTNGYPHNTRNIALSNGKRIAGTSTIPGLGEYWWVGGIPIATLSVENNPVHVVYFAQPDIWGGSKQPAFKPQVINSYQSFWDGYFWVFPIHAAVGINFTIDLGSYGPPVFMDAPSALDLRGVTRTGFQAETITGWSSTGFDAIHSPTDNTYWHDQFPLATTVRDELLEKQEVFPPPLFANRTDLGVFWLWRSATSIDFALHSGGGPIVPGPTGVIPVRAVDQNYGYHAIPAVALAPGLSSVRLTYHYPGGGTVNRWSPPFTTWDIVELGFPRFCAHMVKLG